tara:strand:- start:7493 stop:8398 length:906 start_codon:yes stop_codon:yes gene_type:complete
MEHSFNQSFKLILLFFIIINISCRPDDEDEEEPLRDYLEQSLDDDQKLVQYLKSHYYNYQDFDDILNDDKEIKIDTILSEYNDLKSLFDFAVQTSIPLVSDQGEIIDHKLYHIVIRDGVRIDDKPSIVDSVYLSYKGKLLNGIEFDKKTNPVWFDTANVIRGFRYGLQYFSPGNFIQRENGTIDFNKFGRGLIFMPSGLGYFNTAQTNIPSYSPLIFEISVFTINRADHDNDGVLSIDEDPNNDGNPYNDDTDEDGVINMYDEDDDGDGILTKDELDGDDPDSLPDDSNNDGIPDYLDKNS